MRDPDIYVELIEQVEKLQSKLPSAEAGAMDLEAEGFAALGVAALEQARRFFELARLKQTRYLAENYNAIVFRR